MKLLRELWWRLRGRIFRKRLRRHVEEDIRTHLELDAERLRAEGVEPREARRLAEERFGDRETIRARMLSEASIPAEEDGWARLVDRIVTAWCHATRSFVASPTGSSLVVITVASTVGIFTLMIAVSRSVLLDAAGVQEPARVASVHTFYPNLPEGMHQQPSHPRMVDHIRQASAVRWAAGFKSGHFTLTGYGSPRRLDGMLTTPGLFDVAGVSPMLGSGFRDVRTGEERVVILSWGLWQDLGADPGLLGSALRLNERPYEVVGVMPPDFRFPRREDVPPTFRFPERPQLWVPYRLPERGPSDLGVMVRLSSGSTLEELQTQLGVRSRAFADELGIPEASRRFQVRAVRLREQATGETRPALLLLLIATGLVVVVGFGNVAGVGVARGERRSGEMAVRMALGTGREGLTLLVAMEALVLGLLIAVVSLAATWGGMALIRNLLTYPLSGVDRLHLSWGTAGVVVLLSLLGSGCHAVGSIVRARRSQVAAALRGARTAGSRGTRRSALVLVAVEVAMTLALIAGATVLTRSFLALTSVDPGFDAGAVLTGEITLPEVSYPDAERVRAVQRAAPPEGSDPPVARFHRQLVQRLEEQPDVAAAAVVHPLPFGGGQEATVYWIEGMAEPEGFEVVEYTVVSEGYFAAMGIPLLAGRDFSSLDQHDSEQVAIVNRAFAERFPGGRALGARVKLGGAPDAPYPWLRVIGIADDAKRGDLAGRVRPEMYVHMSQGGYTSLSTMHLVARPADAIDASDIGPTIRSTLEALDGDVPLEAVRPMSAFLDDATRRARYTAQLVLTFSILALLITGLGLYSVIAYAVATRRRELAVRVAVGASPSRILKTVMGETTIALIAGLALGGAALYAGAALLESMVFEVAPFEPLSVLIGAIVLAGTVLLAAQGPARASLHTNTARVLTRE